MKAKKQASKLLSILLILGVITTIGFLSFTGMLLITPYISIAAASFFFAVVVEGEVYKQNIFAGVKKLFSKNHLKKTLIDRELKKLLKNEENLGRSQFLRDYKAQLNYVHYLKLIEPGTKKYQYEKKRLKMMKKYFGDFLFSDKEQRTPFFSELNALIPRNNRDALKQELSSKRKLNYAMGITYALAGVCCTFASIYSIHSGALVLMSAAGFTLAPTLLFAGIIPLAIMAGLGYAVIMYRNVSDMIANDTIKRCLLKLSKFFHHEPGQNKAIFVLKATGVAVVSAIVIGLCVFAMVATAGTWWIAMKQGARLIPYIAAAGNWIRNIAIPAMALPTFLFNLNNSLATLKKIGKFSFSKVKEQWQGLKNTKESEGKLQFINPFRALIKVIELPVKFATFILHLASGAVMSDNLSAVPPKATSVLLFSNELLVDGGYMMASKSGDHHDHEHGTIIDKLLTFALLPLHFLSTCWHWATSRKTENSPKFVDCFKLSIGIKVAQQLPPPPVSEISNAWKHQEIIMKLKKETKRYEKSSDNLSLTHKKYQVLSHLKKELKARTTKRHSYSRSESVQGLIRDELTRNLDDTRESGYHIISQHRSAILNRKPAHSQKFIDELLGDESYQSVQVSI